MSDLDVVAERIGWAQSADDLIRLIPRLSQEAPPLAMLADGPAFLLGSPVPFLTGLVECVCDAVQSEQSYDTLIDASDTTVREDPLVQVLLALWSECGRAGARCQGVPTLAVVWAVSALVSGQAHWLNRLPGPLAYRWTEVQAQLSGEGRAACLQKMTARIGARMGAAILLARGEGIEIPAGGLARSDGQSSGVCVSSWIRHGSGWPR